MNKTYRLALVFGAATLVTSSLAFAANDSTASRDSASEAARESFVPEGTFGDPGKATLVTSASETTLTLPCDLATFQGRLEVPSAEGGSFSALGIYKSSLASTNAPTTPVLLTGTASPGPCIVDACPAGISVLTVTLTNLETYKVIGNYTFNLGASGVGVHCQ
jgi:hypothetical protein